MGFMQAMKGANNAWGTVVCEDGMGTIGPEKLIDNRAHRLLLAVGTKTLVFDKNDVRRIQIIAQTSEWIRYLLVLKNNKRYVLTFIAFAVTQKGKTMNMGLLNFEWWLFNHIYSDAALAQGNASCAPTSATTAASSAPASAPASTSTSASANSTTTVAPKTTPAKPKAPVKPAEPWYCRKCGAKNNNSSIYCNSCGEYK